MDRTQIILTNVVLTEKTKDVVWKGTQGRKSMEKWVVQIIKRECQRFLTMKPLSSGVENWPEVTEAQRLNTGCLGRKCYSYVSEYRSLNKKFNDRVYVIVFQKLVEK